MRFDLILVGYGNVARRFVRLLEERRRILERDCDVTTRIVAIATRHLQQRTGGRQQIGDYTTRQTMTFLSDALRAHRDAAGRGRLVLVETTTLDIRQGRPAIDHIQTALAAGAHAITANKGPAAFAYRRLTRLSHRAGRRFLFEGAVMDGVPVFNLVRETLPAVGISGFRGVVNSTTNFILTAMERGQPFAAALQAMQRAGIAEADPSLDVDGWDAAAKTAALANVVLDARMTPHDVDRSGIGPSTARAVARAQRRGRHVKLVAEAARRGGRVVARVGPAELAADDPLAALEGQQNAIVFTTDLLGEIAIVQRGGGLTQTAYALVSDLVTIARSAGR